MISVVGWRHRGSEYEGCTVGNKSRAVTSGFIHLKSGEKKPFGKVLQSVLDSVAEGEPHAIAVTMTAELSDIFQTKREECSLF
jgi:hypothetical protein